MTLAMSMTLLASVMALVLSIGASSVAVLSWRLSNLSSASKQSARLTELELTIEALTTQLRNIRSRLNMQKFREKTPSTSEIEADPAPAQNGDDAAATRARLNDIIAQRAKGL